MFTNKNKLILATSVIFLMSFFLTGCQRNAEQNLNVEEDFNINQAESADQKNSEESVIGGDKDEHGCLIAAGYSWCEAKNKCLRVWEESCLTSQNKVYQPVVLEDLEWKKYTNDSFGYSLDYPTMINVMGNNFDEQVEFNGQLIDNQWWPQISISHYNNDFYRPGEGIDVSEWVKPFPGYKFGEDISIAGLKTVHYAQSGNKEFWPADYFYFIKNGQLYNITITHSNNHQDWDLYKRILQSFSFAE